MQEHVSLAKHSTMRLGGPARYLVELSDATQLPELLAWAKHASLPVIMIGSGSNIVWKDEGFDGLVIVNKIQGFEVTEADEDILVTIGAGEQWDSAVERCSAAGMNGIAELSLIPGTTGATPVQNVGAYGREISDVLVSVEAYDTQTDTFVTLENEACDFGYRTSRFKTTDAGRFFITNITLQLSRSKPQPPYYRAVEDYFAEHALQNPTVHDVRKAVIAIRRAKLPDPKEVANNGSFFANPIVSKQRFAALPRSDDIPHWVQEDGTVKLSAAWLITASGFADYHDPSTGMATWPKQPLVFVNESAKTTQDLLQFKRKITDTVKASFGIDLHQEPELLPR